MLSPQVFQSKYQIWQKKRQRIKYRIKQKNISNHPRLVVYRSNTNIYAQLVDDEKNITVLAASSIDKSLKKSIDKAVNKIEKIILDRNGYKYHGRVKALTEAIRSAEITI